jgi:hypothetical protein
MAYPDVLQNRARLIGDDIQYRAFTRTIASTEYRDVREDQF